MATHFAHTVAEELEDWIGKQERRYQEHATEQQKAMCKHCFSSYEEAHESWLHHEGFDRVACDYSFAVEVLLTFLSRLESERTVQIKIIEENDPHAWEHMTDAAFRRGVYNWQNARKECVHNQIAALTENSPKEIRQ